MTRQHPQAPSLDIDFYSDETLKDPAGTYRTMRDAGPVVWLCRHQIHAICSHEALTRSLRNHRVFQSGQGVSINEDVNKILVGSTLNSDPPQHDLTRAITFAPLTPKALQEVKSLVTTEAKAIARTVAEMGTFDAAQDLAPHLPLKVVRKLVGLGGGENKMLDWGAATFELMGDPKTRGQKARENLKEMRIFLEDPETLAQLSPEGWAKRATDAGIAQGMSQTRASELMRDYIAPSLDTTISAIGYAIHLFAKHPEEWDKLRKDRSLIKNAIEEVVRLNTPIRAFTRKLSEAVEVQGVQLSKDERVLMVFGAANRDPAKFPDPDRFDVTRDTRGHVGFGHGIHACLGMHLARLEMSCLFEALADRVASFELTGKVEVARNATIHAYSSLPVRAVLPRT